MKKYSFVFICFLWLSFNKVYGQTKIYTDGIIIIDTVNFSGYMYCLQETSRFMLSVDTLVYKSNEERLKNGDVLYISPRYFNLLISAKSKLEIASTCMKLSGYKSKVKDRYYTYSHKIILGVISSNDLKNRLADYLDLEFESNIPIFVFTEMCE